MENDSRSRLRRSVLNNDVVVSPVRRRSSFLPQTPNILELSNNDDAERAQRRNLAETQKKFSNISTPPTLHSERNKNFNPKDVMIHFERCVKLLSENKITAKNAWDLNIVELLHHVFPASGSLQAAATSLEVSGKIFAIRVDDVYARVMKLAHGMARNETNMRSEEAAEGENNSLENEGNVSKRQKKKRARKKKSTVVKDRSTLFAPLAKLESTFFTVREDREISSMDNLFTNSLPLHPSGHTLMVMSKDKFWVDSEDLTLQNITSYKIMDLQLTEFHICKPFGDFHLDKWNPDEEERLLPYNSEVVFDEQGIPIPELDGSIPNIFADNSIAENGYISDDNEPEPGMQIFGDDVDHIVKTDYGYNIFIKTSSGQIMEKIWAGPSHWKLKNVHRAKPRFSGKNVEEEAKMKNAKKQKKIQTLVFPDSRENETKEIDLQTLGPPRKTKNLDERKLYLPAPDLNFVEYLRTLPCLMNRPDMTGNAKLNDSEDDDEEINVSGYNYENLNDSQYLPADMEGADGDHEVIEENVVAAQENYSAENLVKAPETLPKTYMDFVTKAKVINIKKLKAKIWSYLTKNCDGSEKVQVDGSFSQLYKELPKYLNNEMRENLSPSLVFVSLLHLCNEQSLKLTRIDHLNGNDFNIKNVDRL